MTKTARKSTISGLANSSYVIELQKRQAEEDRLNLEAERAFRAECAALRAAAGLNW